MRVNPDSTADLLAAIQRTRRQQEQAVQQLASGRRVNRPSDDPAASALLVQNASRSAQCDEFLHNISALTAVFQTADSTLNSVVLALQQAITLGVEGANGTLNASNRQAVAEQVRGIQQNVLTLANVSQDGTYLFAGTASRSAPFIADPDAPSGVRYAGNDQINYAMIGEGRSVALNQPGSQIFCTPGADVFQALHNLASALDSGSSDGVATATQSLRTAFDHVTAQRVFYGNMLSQFGDQQTFLKNQQLQSAQEEQDLAGADEAETITRMVNAQTAAQATMNASARLLKLSLLDYLG